MRLFFAFELDDAAREAAGGVADDLAERLVHAHEPRAVTWVDRENLHVTLRFLGEVDDALASSLQRGLGEPLPCAPFALELGGGGCFPASGPPRVAWIGVSEGAGGARAVFERLDERLVPLGFAREGREYTPHITLGRVRHITRRTARELCEWLAATPTPLAAMTVRNIVLYRSHLTPRGPRYEIVLRTNLTRT